MRSGAAALLLVLAGEGGVAEAPRFEAALAEGLQGVRASALGTVTISGPSGSPLVDATPTLTAQASGFDASEMPLALTIQVATSNNFATPLLLDSTVTATSLTITLPRPLPDKALVYWRAKARTVTGTEVFSATEGPRPTAEWLRLVLPNDAGGVVLRTTQPRFLWTSARVAAPPGPWEYELRITSVATGLPVIVATLAETTYVPSTPLESNSSYRWSVRARLVQGAPEDSIVVASRATFVISTFTTPRVTLLYQNFPNPFPVGGRTTTCIWFDLRELSTVTLEIYDLRGRLVRRLLPRGQADALMPPGRYGRAPGGGETGCDPATTWDGSAGDGRQVPAGIYLVRLRGGGVESVKKIVFRGQ
jgi:hypothetical protein